MKNSILILVLSIFGFTFVGHAKAQSMDEIGNIPIKQAKLLIRDLKGKIDPELASQLKSLKISGNPYVLDDGRILIFDEFDDMAVAYDSRTELQDLLEGIPSNSSYPNHLLSEFPEVGQDPDGFLKNGPDRLVALALSAGFTSTQLDSSIGSLDELQGWMLKNQPKDRVKENFAGLVWYIGEVMRKQISGSWITTQSRYVPEIIEPEIKGPDGRVYSPYEALCEYYYTELDHELMLATYVRAELGKYRLIDAQESGQPESSGSLPVQTISVEEAIKLIDKLDGEPDSEIQLILDEMDMAGSPIRLSDGRYILVQEMAFGGVFPMYDSKETLQRHMEGQRSILKMFEFLDQEE